MAIPTPYSYRQYTGDGSAKDFQIPFPYLQRDHVHLYLDDRELVVGADYDWVTDVVVRLAVPPQAAVAGNPNSKPQLLTVRRVTPEDDQIVQWKDGSYIIADDLNESDKQWLYLIQEHHDALMRIVWNSPSLPGGGGPVPGTAFWNNLARHLDPGKGTAAERAQTITKYDQTHGDWPADGKDQYIATTDALLARLEPYLQDTTPLPYGLPEAEQEGKFWVDKDDLILRYWDKGAGAWIDLANTGPPGKGGPGIFFGDAAPADPLVDAWYSTIQGRLYVKYDDGNSVQWVDASPTAAGTGGGTGPPARHLVAGNGVAATATNEIQTIDQGVI
jgi:hypothetical protein